MQSRRCNVNPICLEHEVHRWHLRATVTAGLLQQQQFLQPEHHDYPGRLTSTAFWSHSFCNRMTHAALSTFGLPWYRTVLRATSANKKEASHVNAFRDTYTIKDISCRGITFQYISARIFAYSIPISRSFSFDLIIVLPRSLPFVLFVSFNWLLFYDFAEAVNSDIAFEMARVLRW